MTNSNTNSHLNIDWDRVRKYIDLPIVALWLQVLHPIPFRTYFEHLVDRELDPVQPMMKIYFISLYTMRKYYILSQTGILNGH